LFVYLYTLFLILFLIHEKKRKEILKNLFFLSEVTIIKVRIGKMKILLCKSRDNIYLKLFNFESKRNNTEEFWLFTNIF